MTRPEWFVALGLLVFALGSIRLLFVRDTVTRLVALNIAGAGVFLVLIALAARTDPPDPVLHALVLTGIVIAVSVTGLGLVLVRRFDDGDSNGDDGGSAS